jgi:hypothetical protein
MAITKKLILNIILVIWVIFSIIYIIHDLWSDFKVVKLNQAYQQGRIDTINELIRQAQTCQQFPVFSGEKRVNLINIDCLKSESK